MDLIGGKEEVSDEVDDLSEDSSLEALVEEHAEEEDSEDLPSIIEELMQDDESQEDYVDYETVDEEEYLSENSEYVDVNEEDTAVRLFAAYCSGAILSEDDREQLERYQKRNLFEGYFAP